MNKLPPELAAMNGAMDMIFGALHHTRPETARAVMIREWEAKGWLVPDCPGCQEFYQSERLPSDVFAPRHEPNNSSHRAHCTCDSCF